MEVSFGICSQSLQLKTHHGKVTSAVLLPEFWPPLFSGKKALRKEIHLKMKTKMKKRNTPIIRKTPMKKWIQTLKIRSQNHLKSSKEKEQPTLLNDPFMQLAKTPKSKIWVSIP